jgi:hypothetical protein
MYIYICIYIYVYIYMKVRDETLDLRNFIIIHITTLINLYIFMFVFINAYFLNICIF